MWIFCVLVLLLTFAVFVCIGVICGYCSRWLENELKRFTEQKSSKSFCCDGQVINRVSPVILAGQVFFSVCCLFFTGSKGDVLLFIRSSSLQDVKF